jgi:tetratricopeptide (TPR) repeat protein
MRVPVIVAIGLLCGSVVAVTDADRVQVYHDFRAAFDARKYPDALSLAGTLVTLTEEQYGASDRSLTNPMCNLATTQYRLRDYKKAEDTYLRAIKIVEDSGGGADRALLRPLHGLGATYFATHQYEDAALILKRALDLSRNLDGLFNVEQMSILDPLIDSLVALNRLDEAERALDYAIRVAETAYGKSDLHVQKPLERSARWQEKMGRYPTARVLYARALQIAEQAGPGAAINTVEPLEGIARTFRLEFVNSDADKSDTSDVHAAASQADPAVQNAQRLNPDGERAILMALKAIDKTEPVDHVRRGGAFVELGDWYLSSDLLNRGLAAYRRAWKEFALGGAGTGGSTTGGSATEGTATGGSTSGGSAMPLAAPRQLAYRAPLASVSRAKSDRDNLEEHFVEVSFTVTREGRTNDVITVETDATPAQQKSVMSAIRRARYAPRLENGDPVETTGVRFRERLLSRKP